MNLQGKINIFHLVLQQKERRVIGQDRRGTSEHGTLIWQGTASMQTVCITE